MSSIEFSTTASINGTAHYIYVATAEKDAQGEFMQVCATELDAQGEPTVWNRLFIEQPGHARSDFDAAVAELVANPEAHINDIHA